MGTAKETSEFNMLLAQGGVSKISHGIFVIAGRAAPIKSPTRLLSHMSTSKHACIYVSVSVLISSTL